MLEGLTRYSEQRFTYSVGELRIGPDTHHTPLEVGRGVLVIPFLSQ